jgi:two-component system NtrC family response regulator
MTQQARKLLIVEDDPGLLKQLKWCFEGYDVYTAENREDAIAELRRNEPGVILQDLGLPPKPEGVEEGFATLAETLKLAPHTKVSSSLRRTRKSLSLPATATRKMH